MKTAKKTTALIVAAFMALMMFSAVALAADEGAPTFRGWGVGASDGETFYTISYTEAATVDYVILPYGATQPTVTQVKNHQDASGNPVDASYCRTVSTIPASDYQHDAILLRTSDGAYADLAPNEYNLFIVAYDAEGHTTDVTLWRFYATPYSLEITGQLTFTVNDGAAPISGATVKVGSDIKTTDGDGKAAFTLSGGVYTYLVQASGYQGVSGSYTADKQTDVKTVSLEAGIGGEYSAVFNIKDDKGTNLKNAEVIIGEVTKTADAGGDVEFFLAPGEYAYTASAMGRITKSGSFAIGDANYIGNIVLTTDPAGVDLVINSHQEGNLGAEMGAILSANNLGTGAVRSLTVNGGEMGGNDFSYAGIEKLFGYDNNIFASVDLSGTTLDGNTLPEGAFYYAKYLSSITLPDTVRQIGSRAFAYCPLTSFTFPDSVQVIGDFVFQNCSALKTVTFPAGVTSLGKELFSNWGDELAPVTDVYMLSPDPTTIETVNANSFYNKSNAVLHFPDGSADAYKNDARDGSATDGKWFGLYIYDPDAAPPVIKGLMAGWWGSGFVVAFSSDSPGQYYYAVVDDGAAAPEIDTSGAGTVANSDMPGFIGIGELTTAKDIYIVLKGINGKLSNILKVDIPTPDAAPADIIINGHTEGKLADEINVELTEANLSYNYGKVGSLTVNGGTISSDDAEFLMDEVYYLTNADFSGTSFEYNTVPMDFLCETGLKTIILPGSVETLGDWAFWRCEELESVTLGSSIPPDVGEDVFAMVPDGAMVYVPSGSKSAYLAVDDGDVTDGKWYGLTVAEIGDTPAGATISPISVAFDEDPAKQADVSTTITWNDAKSVTDIKAGGTSIGADNYRVNGNTLIIKKEYLATKTAGDLVLTVEFGGGGTATLTIKVGKSAADTGSGNGPTYSSRSLTDAVTGVTISGDDIHKMARLTTSPLKLHSAGTCAACDAIRKAQAGGELILGYDISLTPPATGDVTISIPVAGRYNGRTVTILHCVNGRLETITATVTDGKAIFTASSLSPFAVTTGLLIPDAAVPNPPKTGDAAAQWDFVMLGLVMIGAVWIVMKRRRA